MIDDDPVAVQLRPIPNGYEFAYHGVDVKAFVYMPWEATAARIMPAKPEARSAKQVLCPMPGLVLSIDVEQGQEVKMGETLAIVEAMKMENVIRAERDGVISRVLAKKGDSLAGRRADHGVRLSGGGVARTRSTSGPIETERG